MRAQPVPQELWPCGYHSAPRNHGKFARFGAVGHGNARVEGPPYPGRNLPETRLHRRPAQRRK